MKEVETTTALCVPTRIPSAIDHPVPYAEQSSGVVAVEWKPRRESRPACCQRLFSKNHSAPGMDRWCKSFPEPEPPLKPSALLTLGRTCEYSWGILEFPSGCCVSVSVWCFVSRLPGADCVEAGTPEHKEHDVLGASAFTFTSIGEVRAALLQRSFVSGWRSVHRGNAQWCYGASKTGFGRKQIHFDFPYLVGQAVIALENSSSQPDSVSRMDSNSQVFWL